MIQYGSASSQLRKIGDYVHAKILETTEDVAKEIKRYNHIKWTGIFWRCYTKDSLHDDIANEKSLQ